MFQLMLVIKSTQSNGDQIKIDLHPYDEEKWNQSQLSKPLEQPLRSDLNYALEVKYLRSNGARVKRFESDKLEIYRNDHRKIDVNKSSKIFEGCPGWSQFTVDVAGETHCTPHLPVQMAKDDPETESLLRMVDYIGRRLDGLSVGDVTHEMRLLASARKGHEGNNIEEKLYLVETILQIYDELLPSFRNGSRYLMQPRDQVVSAERVCRLDPRSLQYICAHPEQLRAAGTPTAFRMGGRMYEPAKFVASANVPSYDIYENRVVSAFLESVRLDLHVIQQICNTRISQHDQIPKQQDYIDLESSLHSLPDRRIRRLEHRTSELLAQCNGLKAAYNQIFGFNSQPLAELPHGTGIFYSVHQYKRIFDIIHEWTATGSWDLHAEDFFFSLPPVYALYETYTFLKIREYFLEREWVLLHGIGTIIEGKRITRRCRFESPDGKIRLDLYMNPAIFSGQRSDGFSGLYRNMTYTVKTNHLGKASADAPYTPDFILVSTDGRISHFLIIDAKHSTPQLVQEKQAGGLIFKYLTSLTPRKREDQHCGLVICCGQKSNESEDCIGSLYDQIDADNEPSPPASFVCISEMESPEEVYTRLDTLLRPMLDFKSM